MKGRFCVALTLGGVLAMLVAACGGGESTARPQPTQAPQPTVGPAPNVAPVATETQAAKATPTPAPTAPPATPTATPAGREPRYGGVLQVRWNNEMRRPWDSWRADSGFVFTYMRAMLSNLVQYRQGTFEFKADLGDRWEVSADGKTYTFHLRPDARWHDGRPVTSKDIAYNFRRGLDPQFTFNKSRVDPIATMETPDDSTFKVVLKDVSNAFLGQVATPFMLMYPAHLSDLAQWQKSPVGTGPFKLQTDIPNVAYEFVKNRDYFEKDSAARRLPYLDGVVFNVIPDNGLGLAAFLTGRVHCGCLTGEVWVSRNEEGIRSRIPGVKIFDHPGALLQVYFNTKRPPFDSVEFRRGFSIGLDKEALGAIYNLGKTLRPASALVPPEIGGQWGLPKVELQKIPGYGSDHATDRRIASQKIQESGIDPKKIKVEVIGPNTSFAELLDLLGSMIKTDFGLDVSVTPLGTAESTQRRVRGDFQAYLMSDGGVIDDPADWYRDFITTGGAQNYGGYANPRVDELLLGQDREQDVAKRRQMAWELQRIELTDFPKTPLFWELRQRATWPEVMDFRVGPLNLQNYDYSDIWLAK